MAAHAGNRRRVHRGGGAAQMIMVADEDALRGPGLDRHLHARAHRRLDLLVAARVRRPGIAGAAEQLEASPVYVEQDGRSLASLPAQPNVKLSGAAPRRPMAERSESLPAERRRRIERL